MLVSIIVPNYNYAQYLDKRLSSILNQTYQNFELILLDDASTDNSKEILESYQFHPKVSHYIINTCNTGSPFTQWMRGIHLAQGEWIWIAEADDWAEPTFLERCMEQISLHPTATVCMTGSRFVDEQDNILLQEANCWDTDIATQAHCYAGMSYNEHNMYWNNCIINASAVVFNKQAALNLVNSLCLQMRYSGDWLFWFQMLKQGDMIEIYDNLNYFRQHTAKVSVEGVKTGNRIKEDIDVIKTMEKILPSLSSYKKKLARGLICRKIRYLDDVNKQTELYQYLANKLGGKPSNYYTLIMNQYIRLICPWLITIQRDRLKP